MRINDTATPVVVLKAEETAGHGALGIVRSFGRLGIDVYTVASYSQTPAFFSRFCRGRFVHDVKNGSPDSSVDYLLDVGKKIGRRAILIPTDDSAAVFLADNAKRMRQGFLFPSLPCELVRALASKKGMYHLAKRYGVPTVETVFPRSRTEVLEFLPKASFPIMLKAIDGRRLWERVAEKMFIVSSEAELLTMYEKVEDPENPNLMLQEYIPGGDDTIWMFNGYFDEHSECLSAFTGKKIRQFPVHRGSTSLGICLRNDTVEKTTTEFLKKLKYKGIVDIGFRYDARDGLYKVLDINPRIGSTFRLFVADNGLDVARTLYLNLTGQPIPQGFAHEGRKWFVEDQDLISCFQYHRDGELTVREWINSFRGVEEAAYFAFDDLFPCVARTGDICKQLLRRWADRTGVRHPRCSQFVRVLSGRRATLDPQSD